LWGYLLSKLLRHWSGSKLSSRYVDTREGLASAAAVAVYVTWLCRPMNIVCSSDSSGPTLQRTNTENWKQIFPEKELRGHSPNIHIHVSVSNL
jgi:hypothetical protein